MGSDYNFIFSSSMRDKVYDNCLEDNRSTYMRFQEYRPIDYRIQRMLATNGREQDNAGDINDIDNHIHEVVYRSFLDSHTYMQNGMVLGIYRILGLASVLISMTGVLNKDDFKRRAQLNPLMALNVYSVLFPIATVFYDWTVAKLLNRYEYLLMKAAKFCWIVLYWAFMIFAYLQYLDDMEVYDQSHQESSLDEETSEFEKLSDSTKYIMKISFHLTLIYPIIAMFYSKMIYECKFMTKATTRQSRISPNANDNLPILDSDEQFNDVDEEPELVEVSMELQMAAPSEIIEN